MTEPVYTGEIGLARGGVGRTIKMGVDLEFLVITKNRNSFNCSLADTERCLDFVLTQGFIRKAFAHVNAVITCYYIAFLHIVYKIYCSMLIQKSGKISRNLTIINIEKCLDLFVKFCGVDIKGKEAILAIVENDDDGNFVHCPSTSKKLNLDDDRDCKSVEVLHEAIKAFAKDHKLSGFVIKTRQATGVMGAGGITFKIEALFQLSGLQVDFVSPQALSKIAKKNTGGIPSSITKYQNDAYLAAVWRLAKL